MKMAQEYSNPSRQDDPHSLPDIEVFQLTAREVAEMDKELIDQYIRRFEFRLAVMNGKTRETMFDRTIEEEGIQGGWFWWSCFPGCLPDSEPMGPFDSYKDALNDARSE
jgi:hypothetical protein